jgi:hypothetical protein
LYRSITGLRTLSQPSALWALAGTQHAAFQIAKLVEQEQWMVAGAGTVAILGAHLLLAIRRTDARILCDRFGLPNAKIGTAAGRTFPEFGCTSPINLTQYPRMPPPNICAASASRFDQTAKAIPELTALMIFHQPPETALMIFHHVDRYRLSLDQRPTLRQSSCGHARIPAAKSPSRKICEKLPPKNRARAHPRRFPSSLRRQSGVRLVFKRARIVSHLSGASDASRLASCPRQACAWSASFTGRNRASVEG